MPGCTRTLPPLVSPRPEEVVAAAALTSLSSGPLPLVAPACSRSPEPGWEPWREALVQPLGSGDWGWDLGREQPPLFPEAAHFLFGEPALRTRKSSVRILFQCLWKSCGTVLGTAPTMQRHIRLVHLGRQAEPEQSDGEENFYYTELDIGVDVLADGLSSLASVPPTLLRPEPPPPVLTNAAPSQAGRSDPAHQGCLASPEVRTCVPALPAQCQPEEAPRGRQEVPEGVRHGAPGAVVHGLPVEEGLPAIPGLSPAPIPSQPQGLLPHPKCLSRSQHFALQPTAPLGPGPHTCRPPLSLPRPRLH